MRWTVNLNANVTHGKQRQRNRMLKGVADERRPFCNKNILGNGFVLLKVLAGHHFVDTMER
jgi:hypothetical protein